MVESLKELSKICQKPDYKKTGNWYVRTILRDAALPATWLLLHTTVTANQVTLISLAIALFGMFVLTLQGTAAFLISIFLLQLWYYLDHVDGQIARYRKTDCLTGRFLDFLTHHIVHTSLFFALGFYAFLTTGSALFILWGFGSTLSILVFNVTHDVKYKTFFEAFEKQGALVMKSSGKNPASDAATKLPSASRRIFSAAHKLCEIHVMVNILTLGALAQIFLGVIDARIILFLFYGILAPGIAVIKVSYILKTRKIDAEYDSLIKENAG